MSTPADVPMPPETLEERMKADGSLWRVAIGVGRLAGLREAVELLDGDEPHALRRALWLRSFGHYRGYRAAADRLRAHYRNESS